MSVFGEQCEGKWIKLMLGCGRGMTAVVYFFFRVGILDSLFTVKEISFPTLSYLRLVFVASTK